MSDNTTMSSNLRDLTSSTTDDGKIELTEQELGRVAGGPIYTKVNIPIYTNVNIKIDYSCFPPISS
jgi:hypothetical protein